MKRRDFLRNAGGTTAALGAGASASSGTVAAQEGGGGSKKPDFGGWLDGAKGGTFKDLRGQSNVTIKVGGGDGLAFIPTGCWIDPGTTVTFKWVTGGHNVEYESKPSGSKVSGHKPIEDQGFTFKETFDTGGIYKYYCDPHRSLGMLGGIAVGNSVPTVSTGGGGGPKELEELGVPIQAHWVGAATILSVIVSIIFTFYVLKYGESPNTARGR